MFCEYGYEVVFEEFGNECVLSVVVVIGCVLVGVCLVCLGSLEGCNCGCLICEWVYIINCMGGY